MSNSGALSPLFSDVRISADDAIVIAAALQDIAEVDGTHPEEQELIQTLVQELSEDLADNLVLPRVTPADVAKRLVDLTGWTHARVQAEMNRLAGVAKVATATSDQLERRLRYAESWLRRLRAR